MTTRSQIDLRQILLEGARDRLRSLGAVDRQEALLAVHSLFTSAAAAGLSDLLPLLSELEEELIAGKPDAVHRVQHAIQTSLEKVQCAESEPPEDVLECYTVEASEHLTSIRTHLQQLASRPGDPQAQEGVYRALHTFKGAAAMVGETSAARAAHELEDLLQDALDHGAELDQGHLTRLNAGVVRLEELVTRRQSPLAPAQHDVAPWPGPERADASPHTPAAAGDWGSAFPSDPERPRSSVERPDRAGDTTTVLRVPLAQTSTLLETARDTRLSSGRVALAARSARRTGDALTSIHHDLLDLAERDVAAAALSRRLGQAISTLTNVTDELERQTVTLERVSGRTQAFVRGLRATTARWIFKRLEVVAEDVARKLDRRLVIGRRGESVEVDRQVAGWVLDPLLHVVRNAVAHGIEDPAQRVALGKERSGRITLEAWTRGGGISFGVSDDGKGIDLDLLRQRLVTKRARTAAEVARATKTQVLEWIFLPGVSTRTEADEVAGRGVGLDAVRSEVARQGGTVEVETWSGQGTRFVITLPHPTETQRVLVVGVGPHRLGIPLVLVQRVEVRKTWGGWSHDIDLAPLLNVEPRDLPQRHRVVTQVEGSPLTLIVDDVEPAVEVTLFPEAGHLGKVGPYLCLGVSTDEQALPIIDLATLLPSRTPSSPPPPPRVLLAEDSATNRALIVGTLTAAGFEVVSAVDGLEAWTRLCGEPFDLLVTDLEMPRLDGLELIGRVRAEQNMAGLPVVVVTSSHDEGLRSQAEALGIEAYVDKQGGEEPLVAAARRAVTRRPNPAGRK